MIPLVERALGHGGRPAVSAADGEATYERLLALSGAGARRLLAGRDDLDGARVAFLAPPGVAWVAACWSIWRAGGVAVPLATVHPEPELAATVEDCAPERLLATPELAPRLSAIAAERSLELTPTAELLAGASPAGGKAAGAEAGGALPAVGEGRPGLIVYTSGTTGRPKGVVTTHANLAAQITSLVTAWEWSEEDRALLVLPLHHVHGIVNVLSCALWSGAVCEMMPRFDADETWRRLDEHPISVFMAVPTVYRRLLAAWEGYDGARRRRLRRSASRLRLMVSGSAALPVSLLERWREVSGHVLLERYGMSEFAMALSNPLHGKRVPGTVGTPLPGVEVRRVDEAGEVVAADDEPAELEVRGPGVFAGYWRRPEETAAAFRPGGWFRTGDVAVVEDGRYRLLGRRSVDIVKTGGYKVSALEVEEVLRTHPAIAECAVVGVPDEEWGEGVAAAVEPEPGAELELEELRAWAKERLAPYKVPTRLATVEELPRNAMGKVTKPAVAGLFEDS